MWKIPVPDVYITISIEESLAHCVAEGVLEIFTMMLPMSAALFSSREFGAIYLGKHRLTYGAEFSAKKAPMDFAALPC